MKIKARLKENLKKYLIDKIRQEQENITITSATELSKEELTSLIKQFDFLKGKPITNIVDNNILAGVIISQGSRVLNLSLRFLLKNLEQSVYEIA